MDFLIKLPYWKCGLIVGGYKDICVDNGGGWLDIRIYASMVIVVFDIFLHWTLYTIIPPTPWTPTRVVYYAV